MLWAIVTIALGLFVLLWFIRRSYLIPDLPTLKNMVKGTKISHICISSRFGRLRSISFSNHNGQTRMVWLTRPVIATRGEIVELRSHMVGTFRWLRSKKSGRSFGRKGKRIKSRQVVGIIEALRLDNEVFSPIDGKIVEVKIRSGLPVEYGQVLALIERKKDSLV